jgi:hypothetical protein
VKRLRKAQSAARTGLDYSEVRHAAKRGVAPTSVASNRR